MLAHDHCPGTYGHSLGEIEEIEGGTLSLDLEGAVGDLEGAVGLPTICMTLFKSA
jgi:hypothetical protein